jgi:hypothetical protein
MCRDDFIETVGICPIVESTIPANTALNVPFNQIISATFNSGSIMSVLQLLLLQS